MKRVALHIEMKLLSDAVLGSGFSIPGGEDIAVCQDAKGYPYLKGSTMKGLLRESMENLLAWTGQPESILEELFGKEGWTGLASDRRLQLTSLLLQEPPADPTRCFDSRTFTSLENGIVKSGTLREAACICSGLRFAGSLICGEEDVSLLMDALRGIKWAGSFRSRGFGRVTVTAERAESGCEGWTVGAAACLHYRLHTELPVLITDLSRSYGNGYETQNLLPGSAIRGAVAGALAAGEPDWFNKHKTELLTGVQFLDALPNPTELPALPALKGFYEDKSESAFQNILKDPDLEPGMKRAKTGAFCAIDGNQLCCWNARTGGVTRIQRGKDGEDSKPFQTRFLEAGQNFEGYILLKDPQLAPMLAQALGETVWLGADRYEGFGKCSVTALEAVEAPDWAARYGYTRQEEIGTELYLLALSPLTMLNAWGEPCGIDEQQLAKALGVGKAEIVTCSTSLTAYGGFNRTWGCREASVRMYERGSMFRLHCDRAPSLGAIKALQNTGLGIRTAEGFGQVLFLRTELFESICKKKKLEQCQDDQTKADTAELRRAWYRWIMENSGRVRSCGLSNSQIGSVQAKCEDALACCSTEDLWSFLKKNREDRGAKHGSRFEKMDELLHEVLDRPMGEILGVSCEDAVEEKLKLLCMLFDHSRKEETT